MIAGITGHQNLPAENISWIRQQLNSYIDENNITLGISSLAIGADQLFVEILLQKKIPYTFVLPCNNYEKTFQSTADLQTFNALKLTSKNIIHLPFKEPAEEAFYAAGKRVVELSDLVIAVWNGEKAKGPGGTGDIVKYALEYKKNILHIHPVTMQINVL